MISNPSNFHFPCCLPVGLSGKFLALVLRISQLVLFILYQLAHISQWLNKQNILIHVKFKGGGALDCSHQIHVDGGLATFNVWLLLGSLKVLTFGLPDLASKNTGHCWRRLSRGHDHQLICEWDLGLEVSSFPPWCLERAVLPTVPTVGAIFEDAALREQMC